VFWAVPVSAGLGLEAKKLLVELERSFGVVAPYRRYSIPQRLSRWSGWINADIVAAQGVVGSGKYPLGYILPDSGM
jgi:hypothetical protein